MMQENELIPRLISEFGYPPNGAKLVADKLMNSSPEIQESFVQFWETGEVSLLTVEGYSVSSLGEEHGMNPIAGFLTLDWLIREPEKAKASLRRGHDIVG
jgi:hypothetical protein